METEQEKGGEPMQEKHRTSNQFVKGLNGIFLAALLAVLLFLLTRAVLRDTLFALPLLMLTAILLSLSSSRTFWKTLSLSTLLVLFFFLEFTFNGDQTPFRLPAAIFLSPSVLPSEASSPRYPWI